MHAFAHAYVRICALIHTRARITIGITRIHAIFSSLHQLEEDTHAHAHA